MTNRVALYLAIFVLGLIVFDMLLFAGGNLIFLGKRMMELIEWLAFWR